ncbi:MAG: hypothetical protein ACI976_003213, partial [Aureispira sp.]
MTIPKQTHFKQMTDILDSIDNEATKTHQKLLILRWVEYAICFLNGLAAFAFL